MFPLMYTLKNQKKNTKKIMCAGYTRKKWNLQNTALWENEMKVVSGVG